MFKTADDEVLGVNEDRTMTELRDKWLAASIARERAADEQSPKREDRGTAQAPQLHLEPHQHEEERHEEAA